MVMTGEIGGLTSSPRRPRSPILHFCPPIPRPVRRQVDRRPLPNSHSPETPGAIIPGPLLTSEPDTPRPPPPIPASPVRRGRIQKSPDRARDTPFPRSASTRGGGGKEASSEKRQTDDANGPLPLSPARDACLSLSPRPRLGFRTATARAAPRVSLGLAIGRFPPLPPPFSPALGSLAVPWFLCPGLAGGPPPAAL
ncbi:hypothetical protein CDD83_9685 [Cordyceps sp. RAO-2017]|nr:hypothetical protein CDD83_9685 [Cordyceps sp. RAO-2017]